MHAPNDGRRRGHRGHPRRGTHDLIPEGWIHSCASSQIGIHLVAIQVQVIQRPGAHPIRHTAIITITGAGHPRGGRCRGCGRGGRRRRDGDGG